MLTTLVSLLLLAGEISPEGTAIEVESYRCVVKSERSILCENIGRVCTRLKAKEEEIRVRRFGCSIETSKNYPCPDKDSAFGWEAALAHSKKLYENGCYPSIFGMLG